MSKVEFSEQLLDTSFVILMSSSIKSEYEQQVFDCICEVCKAEGISVRKYCAAMGEIGRRLKELEELKDDCGS